MVLLSTSDSTGVAYVQTTNLDGESNLKTRYAKQETHTKFLGEERINGLIKCEKPNRNSYGFHANMDLDGKSISIGPANIILRRCELKNTDWPLVLQFIPVERPKLCSTTQELHRREAVLRQV